MSNTFGNFTKELNNKKVNKKNPSKYSFEETLESKKLLSELESISKENQKVILLMGAAGTGKSSLINLVRNKIDKSIVTVAPTGMAAWNINATTIHSLFRLDFSPLPKVHKMNNINGLIIENIDLLIIDEISMVNAPTLDAISESLKIHKNSKKPFGGASLLLCGDLFQLEPVTTEENREIIYSKYSSHFFFGAKSLSNSKPIAIELKRSYRQNEDENFLKILSNIRVGKNVKETVEILNKHCYEPNPPESVEMYLCARTATADEINKNKIQLIESDSKIYKASTEGDPTKFNKESSLPAPSELELKVGTQVMITKNDAEKRWVNGTLAEIKKLNDNSINISIDGDEFELERESWTLERYKFDEETKEITTEKIAEYSQLPIRLGWAVTIHKSQGLTLNSCAIDIGDGKRAFSHGQIYVALSRCKKMKNLYLKTKITEKDIKLDKSVLNFQNNFFT
jgi:ATP-dependent DNA helicase PIF1